MMIVQSTSSAAHHSYEYKIEPTYSSKFHPIGIVHVVVNDLPAMCRRHAARAVGHCVGLVPQCLNDLTILNTGTKYEVEGEPREALSDVAVDVELSDPTKDCETLRHLKMGTLGETGAEMDRILTHDVIEDQNSSQATEVRKNPV